MKQGSVDAHNINSSKWVNQVFGFQIKEDWLGMLYQAMVAQGRAGNETQLCTVMSSVGYIHSTNQKMANIETKDNSIYAINTCQAIEFLQVAGDAILGTEFWKRCVEINKSVRLPLACYYFHLHAATLKKQAIPGLEENRRWTDQYGSMNMRLTSFTIMIQLTMGPCGPVSPRGPGVPGAPYRTEDKIKFQ